MRLHAELRSEVKGNTLHGYASVFDQLTTRVEGRPESIARGAFTEVLASKPDVRALVNHDASLLLGRTRSGTLRLAEDDHGLEFEVDIPDTTVGRDLRVLLERGDITGASFGFVPGKVDRSGGTVVHRSVRELYDVSAVTFPAYEGAEVALRNAHPNTVRKTLAAARYRARFGGTK